MLFQDSFSYFDLGNGILLVEIFEFVFPTLKVHQLPGHEYLFIVFIQWFAVFFLCLCLNRLHLLIFFLLFYESLILAEIFHEKTFLDILELRQHRIILIHHVLECRVQVA